MADMIFNEIEPNFIELMTDPFGNYLCQKLIEASTPALRLLLSAITLPSTIANHSESTNTV